MIPAAETAEDFTQEAAEAIRQQDFTTEAAEAIGQQDLTTAALEQHDLAGFTKEPTQKAFTTD